MSASKDRLWRVPGVATFAMDGEDDVLNVPEEGDLEQAMLETLAMLKRFGGTVVISADRTDRALWEPEVQTAEPDERWESETDTEETWRWETVGLVFRYESGRVPPMPRPRRALPADPYGDPEPASSDPFPDVVSEVEEEDPAERVEAPTEERPAPELTEATVAGAPAPPGG